MTTKRNKNTTPFGVRKGHYLVGNQGIYKVREFLGEGTYGKVAKCTKLGSQDFYAIKIMKSDLAGQREMKLMKMIQHLDPEDNHLIRMYECFSFRNMTCIVYEILAESFDDCLREYPYPIHLSQIRAIAQQLLKALSALESMGLAHCDIKPDNVMFAGSESINVKLIDFGLALKTEELETVARIQVTPFRAPEVILGLFPLNNSVDMWTLGMVLACAYIGDFPFPDQTEYDTIRAMVQIFGLPEPDIFIRAENTRAFFIRDKDCDNPGWRLQTPEEHEKITGDRVKHVNHVTDLDRVAGIHGQLFGMHDDDDHRVFIDLLKRMLEVNPQKRITPSQALTHDFITMKHLSGEGKAMYAATAEQIIGMPRPSSPSPSFSLSASQTSIGSLKTSASDISSYGSYSCDQKTSVASAQSSHNISSSERSNERLETPTSDGSMTNDPDTKEVPSAVIEDEPSTPSSLHSSSCDSLEKPVSQDNLEKTEEIISGIKKENKSFGVGKGQYLKGNLGTYEIGELLGEGGFGTVSKCKKLESQTTYAIKIMKDVQAGRQEFESMKLIKDLDPDENHLMKMYECFSFQNVICLVFEILEISLEDFLSKNKCKPVPLRYVRAIAQQMFQSLNALKSIGVVHGDVKLDNIMFVQEESLSFKLIDFGVALEATELSTGTDIQIAPFKAPEIILGLPLDESIDMWALGVVLASVYCGNYPFPDEYEYETIRALVQIFGLPDEELLNAALNTQDYFTWDSRKDCWRLFTAAEYSQTSGLDVDRRHVTKLDRMTEIHRKLFKDYNDHDHRVFIDLLKRMLEVNPENRITPSQALAHDFITLKHLSGESKDKHAATGEDTTTKTQNEKKKKKKKKNLK